MENFLCTLQKLETSAQILLAPPNLVAADQRRLAEAVFIDFQKTKSPFQICRFILETSKAEYALFQSASLLKQAVIREWNDLSRDDRESLRGYLLQYVMHSPQLAASVREQLLLVVAIMVKRECVEVGEEVIEKVLSEVSQLISSGNPPLQTIGCSVLMALLNEYSSSTKSSDIGLTWETHLMAKKKFETTELRRIFRYCLEGLNEFAKLDSAIPPEAAGLLKRFLLIAEQVLSWNFQFTMFLSRKLVCIFEGHQSPTLRPSAEWKEVLLQSSVIELFFKLHSQLRLMPDLCHHVLQCLNQLASLNGILMNNDADRKSYLTWFMTGLLKMLSYQDIKSYEAVIMSNIVLRVQQFFPPLIMSSLPFNALETYLTHLSNVTCHFGEIAFSEETLEIESQLYVEAFEHILEVWVIIIQGASLFPPNGIHKGAIEIFNLFIRCHLCPPNGTRGLVYMLRDIPDKEIDEIEDDDRTKFKDQLIVIGMLGRMALDLSFPLLIKLLEEKVTKLHEQLQRIQYHAMTVSDSALLSALNEDLHWLVLIIGHLFVSVGEGETMLIPAEITRFSIQQAATVNLETTLRVLASPGNRVSDIPNADRNTDSAIRLIAAVLRLCEVEKRALEANLTQLLSPELALSLVWFISQWSITYLLPNENFYTEMSPTLTGAFGRDSEGGQWTLDYLLTKLESNLSLWNSEQKVVTETAESLVSLLNNVERGTRAVTCKGLTTLMKKQSENAYSGLSTSARRSLFRALVIAGTANKDVQSKNKYWDDLLKPLQDRFHSVLYNEAFSQNFQNEQIKSQVLDLIECFIGVADGCTVRNVARLFPFLLPIMNDLVKLVDVYHNYSNLVGTVFQFFCTCAKRILFYLNQDDSNSLYKCCLNMIEFYAKHNSGRHSKEASAEEEQYQDLLVLMQLLSDLLSKDFVDFSARSTIPRIVMRVEGSNLYAINLDNNNDEQEPKVLAADVALNGLNIIMPMMTAELLKFPNLCLQYYKLITFICEIFPNKVCQLPADLFKTLLMSIEIGLTMFTQDITSLSLDFLSVLGIHVHKTDMKGQPAYEALEPFLKMVFDLLLNQPLETTLMLTATNTLFTLICCFQERFQALVQLLINAETDTSRAQRLLDSFNRLMSGVQFVMDRSNRSKFTDNFEEFITTVYGFLCVK